MGTVGTVLFEVLLGWVAPVFAGAAAVASWAAIALRRTEAGKPKWPWERRPDGS
ncbi:hypothetical protein ACFOEP_13265 [Microbacterium amylolyticum]|uniref:hypothetical protein n=1 Tax=Microbacterium amylolyticum TaxID=936337 RepID=UPI00361AAA32